MDRRNVDIVLVRMDKIGDLVLSLPVDRHPTLLGANVHWFISSGMKFIADHALPARQASEFNRGFSPAGFMRMVAWLRRERPRAIVLLHSPWWVSLAAWTANVPERIGRLSQWHSFLFLNLGVRQKRSTSDRHESDFNFDMVEWGFNRLGVRASENLPQVKKNYLRLGPPDLGKKMPASRFRVVHPGMFGSALNWPMEKYRELIDRLKTEMPVAITGTAADKKYLHGLEDLKGQANILWLVGELNTLELLDLLAQAHSVIAPSTGVLHLAAGLGRPTLGIYSPRKVEHPRRWGPKGPQAAFCLPPVTGESEKFAPEVMALITVDEVIQRVHELEQAGATAHSHPGI